MRTDPLANQAARLHHPILPDPPDLRDPLGNMATLGRTARLRRLGAGMGAHTAAVDMAAGHTQPRQGHPSPPE